MGPSPLVRGNRQHRRRQGPGDGSIPARAGKPGSSCRSSSGARVHPRSCGETRLDALARLDELGPSPLVRGNRPRCERQRCVRGSIPARAGKPTTCSGAPGLTTVHPRSCGETVKLVVNPHTLAGPSPLVRGNPPFLRDRQLAEGSIPARAGKPTRRTDDEEWYAVHPRSCGETHSTSGSVATSTGPSPLVRGNRRSRPQRRRDGGSIPARAGKPRRISHGRPSRRVHPRSCGETRRELYPKHIEHGPSPLVRGNHVVPIRKAEQRRSIPARAGKPDPRSSNVTLLKVHPRSCGETRNSRSPKPCTRGPSPLVRGNRQHRQEPVHVVRSIPARAGKPSGTATSGCMRRVHPRSCGETAAAGIVINEGSGPSPLVRGNHAYAVEAARRVGSIPARAGKPPPTPAAWQHPRVHPRSCGETDAAGVVVAGSPGPSPLVRGNQRRRCCASASWGSIPARAGKPIDSSIVSDTLRVHPRSCGETVEMQLAHHPAPGPSPLVRGNLATAAASRGTAGSIPARAGKPQRGSGSERLTWVHPRSCGETRICIVPDDAREGPSPLVRGNRFLARFHYRSLRSIPARAGKPLSNN